MDGFCVSFGFRYSRRKDQDLFPSDGLYNFQTREITEGMDTRKRQLRVSVVESNNQDTKLK